MRKWFALGIVFLTCSCRYGLPPEPSESLVKPIAVVAPLLNEDEGQLLLLEDGMWAWRGRDDQTTDQGPDVGELVVFEDLDSAWRHYFGVVRVQKWGLVMQRLDTLDVRPHTRGTLKPLSLSAASNVHICSGVGPIEADDACLLSAQPATRWDVYRLDSKTRVEIRDPDRGSMPVARSATVWAGARAQVFEGRTPTAEGDAWVAFPARSTRRPARPTVLASDACGPLESVSSDVVRGDLDAHTFLAIESAAIEYGVDAIVRCDDGSMSVAVPGIHRAGLPQSDPRLEIASMLTLEPIEISGEPEASGLAIDGLAHLGAGDAHTAEFLIERSLEGLDDARDFQLRSADVAASTGRPEVALRRAVWATRTAWNPEANPFRKLARAHIRVALGLQGSTLAELREVASLASSSGDTQLTAWLAWLELKRQLSKGASGKKLQLDDLLSRSKGNAFAPWRALFKAEVARKRSAEALESLRDEFDTQSASALWTAYNGTLTTLECPTGCSVDALSRRLGSLVESATVSDIVEAIERAPRADRVLRLHVDDEVFDRLGELPPEAQVRIWTAIHGVIPVDQEPEVEDRLVAATSALVSLCHEIDLRFLARATTANFTDRPRRDRLESLHWLSTKGLEAACSGSEALLAAARSEDGSPVALGWDPTGHLFEALLATESTPDGYRKTLANAAEYAIEIGGGERCVAWNLALGASFAQSGRLEPAQRWTSRASRCDSNAFRDSYAVLAGYLNFEQSGHIPRGLDESAVRVLRRVLNQDFDSPACVGVLPTSYDIVSALHPELASMAKRARMKRRPPQELELVKSSDSLFEAREALEAARTAILSGDAVAAFTSLKAAHDDYSRLENLPGIARTSFLIEELFDGRKTYVEDEDRRPAARSQRASWHLRRGQVDQLIESQKTQHAPVLAWLEGGDEALTNWFEGRDVTSVFCTPPTPPAADDADSTILIE